MIRSIVGNSPRRICSLNGRRSDATMENVSGSDRLGSGGDALSMGECSIDEMADIWPHS